MAKDLFIYKKRYIYWDKSQTQLCWEFTVKININNLLESLSGYSYYYYSNGIIMREGNHKDSKRDGLWRYYHRDGKLEGLEYYIR
jgi:antitoxin component YwqK of YwqJK toxin-antitoxin module